MDGKENKLILYKDDDGKVSMNVRFADEDLWLTQAQLVELYQSSKSNVSEHLTNIFNDHELEKDSVVRNFRTTASDGKNYIKLFFATVQNKMHYAVHEHTASHREGRT